MHSLIKLSVVCAVCLAAPLSLAAQEEYSTWSHTKAITVNTTATNGGAGVAGSLGGFPVLVRLTTAHTDVFTQAKAGGADIRFRRLSGPHLPYQIERWDPTAQAAEIWVRLDTVLGDNATQTFNMYWGKASAADSSSGARTFDAAGGHQGVWHFAGSLNDATTNAIHGADEGTSDASGAIGRGREFNGGGRILLGNNPAMASGDTDKFTVEAWVNWTSIGTGATDRYRTIINHGTTNNADQVFLYARNPSSGGDDPHYSFGYYTGSSSNAALGYGIAADGGAWTHVTGVYDGAEWRLYRNGALAASEPKSGSPVSSAEDWIIGAWGTSRYFVGNMDEVRFSNRVRSPDWIKLSHRTQQPGAGVLTFGATQVPSSLSGRTNGESTLPFGLRSGSHGGALLTLPSGFGRANVAVTDLSGRTVWARSVELNGVEGDVQIAPLRRGVYVARVTVFTEGTWSRTGHQSFTVVK